MLSSAFKMTSFASFSSGLLLFVFLATLSQTSASQVPCYEVNLKTVPHNTPEYSRCSPGNCADGEKVVDYVACDGVADCKDGSDESSKICFDCGDGQKVVDVYPPMKTDSVVCNGYNECNNGYDESGLTCSAKKVIAWIG